MRSDVLLRYECPCGCRSPILIRSDRPTQAVVCPLTSRPIALPKSGERFGRKQWETCTHPRLLRSAAVLLGYGQQNWHRDHKSLRRRRLLLVAVARSAFPTCQMTAFHTALGSALAAADSGESPALAVESLGAGVDYVDPTSWKGVAAAALIPNPDLSLHPFRTLEQYFPSAALVAYRDLLPNPFRLPRALPEWRTSTVLDIAASAYTENEFSRSVILADALEDAGCDELPLLNHLRGGGPHFRGCWAVDAVLGRSV
jgi:hypothetical protein